MVGDATELQFLSHRGSEIRSRGWNIDVLASCIFHRAIHLIDFEFTRYLDRAARHQNRDAS